MITEKKHDSGTASAWNATNRDNQKYDVWLQWLVSSRCNLTCQFCFNSQSLQQKEGHENGAGLRKIISSLQKLKRIPELSFSDLVVILKRKFHGEKSPSPEKIDIKALMACLNRSNKIFKIGFVGGEPFLISNFIEACVALTEKHYISLNTNLSSLKITEFCEKIDPLRVVHFHASAHVKELERLNLMNRYVANFLMCRERGFNIFAKEVAYPPLLGEVEKYRELFQKEGISLSFGPFIGEHDGKEYPSSYTKQEIEVFGLNTTADTDIGHLYQKGTLCNEGNNVARVGPDGTVRTCRNTILGNIYGKIRFRDGLIRCTSDFCGCPLKSFDQYLFEKAMQESKNRQSR